MTTLRVCTPSGRVVPFCGWILATAMVALLQLAPCCAVAQSWEVVVPGIEYRYFRVSVPPNDVFVTRMDRTSPEVIVDASLAYGKVTQPNVGYNAETIPAQVARYDGAFGYWGRETARYRYKVVAAINGNGFSTDNGCPDSAMAMNGALIKRTFGPTATEVAGPMGFLYKIGSAAPTPGTPYMSNLLSLPADRTKNRISFADGTWLQFHGLNDVPKSNSLVLYTHHHGAKTPVTSGAFEVTVKLDNSAPLRIIPWSNYVRGTVTNVRPNSTGQTSIPFDSVVIVASGNKIAELASKTALIGSEVRFSQETSDSTGVDWTNMYMAIGPMWGVVLRDGVKPDTTSTSYHVDVHPRTAVAYNESHIYFVVVDGRSARSIGMTLSELANLCRDSLGATHAVNLDGGGSSIMWVDGQIKNVPSDGSPRPVANGLMMIQLEPKEVSTAAQAGQVVRSNTPGKLLNVNSGPGIHFHTIVDVPTNTELTILDHHLNGLRAQDINGGPGYWWKVRTPSGAEGWVVEASLIIPSGTMESFSVH